MQETFECFTVYLPLFDNDDILTNVRACDKERVYTTSALLGYDEQETYLPV